MRSVLPFLEKAQSWFPALLIFVFCFAPKPSSLIIVLWLLNNVILWFSGRVKFQWNRLFFSMVLLYLVFVAGTLFTHDIGIALGILSKKLSLLVFPVIFALQKKESFDLKPYVIAFFAGLLVVVSLGFAHSFQAYMETDYLNGSFTSSVFSYIHHPTYLAVFLTMSVFFFRIGMKAGWKGFNIWTGIVWVLFVCLVQFIIFSFAGILFHFLVLVYLTLDYLRKKLPKTALSIALVLITLVPFIAYFGVQRVQDEVNNTLTDLKRYLSNPNQIYTQAKAAPHGNNIRILLWTTSVQQFYDHPLGAGTGNFDEVIGARLRAKGLDEIAEFEYNSHNQFLQIAVELGVIGLLSLLAMVGLLFRMGIKYKNELLIWCGLSFVFNSLFESMLQQQSGIVFYTMVFCIGILLIQQKRPFRTEE